MRRASLLSIGTLGLALCMGWARTSEARKLNVPLPRSVAKLLSKRQVLRRPLEARRRLRALQKRRADAYKLVQDKPGDRFIKARGKAKAQAVLLPGWILPGRPAGLASKLRKRGYDVHVLDTPGRMEVVDARTLDAARLPGASHHRNFERGVEQKVRRIATANPELPTVVVGGSGGATVALGHWAHNSHVPTVAFMPYFASRAVVGRVAERLALAFDRVTRGRLRGWLDRRHLPAQQTPVVSTTKPRIGHWLAQILYAHEVRERLAAIDPQATGGKLAVVTTPIDALVHNRTTERALGTHKASRVLSLPDRAAVPHDVFPSGKGVRAKRALRLYLDIIDSVAGVAAVPSGAARQRRP